jgi:hypothetical protein
MQRNQASRLYMVNYEERRGGKMKDAITCKRHTRTQIGFVRSTLTHLASKRKREFDNGK